jgi:RNA-directed DNA polymerase
MQIVPMLKLQRKPWFENGHLLAAWNDDSRALLKHTLPQLYAELKPYLKAFCTHVKGNGGVKGTVRWVMAQLKSFQFGARFDVKSYYQSIRHDILLKQLDELNIPKKLQEIVKNYLTVPDLSNSGIGMVAGGSLSPLLGAVYLLPLDYAMQEYVTKYGMLYVRYMDDILILAKKRRHLRMSIKIIYLIIKSLDLRLHQKEKRFVGRTEKGFDFLGYHFHPMRKLRPSAESLHRLVIRAGRLYEQADDPGRLWGYVSRWYGWLRNGLSGLLSLSGGFKRYWIYVLKKLKIGNIKTNNENSNKQIVL